MRTETWALFIGSGQLIVALLLYFGISPQRLVRPTMMNHWMLVPILGGLAFSGVGFYRAFRVNSPEIAIERWRTFQKEVVVGHKFVNERVVLDGKSYRTCTFENVTFVYEGRAPFDFIQNSVKGSINVDVGASQSLSNLTMFMKAIGMIAPSSAIVLGPERLPYDPHSKFPPEQPSRPR